MKLLLIDGNSYCYRAYYAIRTLATSKGQPTNAVYGFIAMMKKLVKDEAPDMLAVAFDLGKPTFRHKLFDDYKAHRKPMPDDLAPQLPVIKDVLAAYNVPIFQLEGYEADDVLATIAKKAAAKKIDTYIITGDKDMLQIVGPYISVCNTHKDGKVYRREEVKERFGVEPEKVLDVMALAGDVSDNIPGVPGIGEKTAIELITKFGSLEKLYKDLAKLKSRAKQELLRKHSKEAEMSKELAALDIDTPIKIDFDKMKVKEPDVEKLVALFRELEFKALLKEVMPQNKLGDKYNLVDSMSGLNKLTAGLKKLKEVTLDIESTSSDPMQAELVGISFCWEEGKAYYVAVKGVGKTLDLEAVLEAIKPVLEDPKIKKVGQNIKYEAVLLANYGICLEGIAFDTMVASYLVNPSKSKHNLDAMALDRLEHKMIPLTDLIGKGKSQITMDRVDVARSCEYCCEDSDATLRLKKVLLKELEEKGLMELFCDVELPLINVLTEMELAGVRIDENILKAQSKKIQKKLEQLTKDIYETAGREFNINSPKQLSQILFEELRLPVVKRTKTGASTDERVLKRLSQAHPLPATLLEYRELSKLKSTYIDTLPRLINAKTGRVHTSFNQAVTATGRLSSSDPNLQNIPIRTEEGSAVRRAFTVDSKDKILMSADYSQIELRILAHLSGDKGLIKAFNDDLDIHSYTASLVYGVKQDDVTPKMRSAAKAVNFGINYGMSAYGLSQQINVSIEEAADFISSYFQRYPKVKEFIDSQVKEAGEKGFVTTLMNRRRYTPEINSSDTRLRQFAERTAMNTPIQGSCADLIKVAMIRIHEEFKRRGLTARMILQVHDELVFELPKSEQEAVVDIVKDKMENVVELNVPIKVNIGMGQNWFELK